MSDFVRPKTGSSYAEASQPQPSATKSLVIQTWYFNKVKNVALDLQNNKDAWLKAIRASMISSGNRCLLGHADDLEAFIYQLEDIFTKLWNLAVLTSSFSFNFELSKDFLEQLADFPRSAVPWLRYIRHTWRPLIHSEELLAVFNSINEFGEFVVKMNAILAKTDEKK